MPPHYFSSIQERLLASIKTQYNVKTSVSEIEQRRTIYQPILDLQQTRRKKLLQTPKALNMRGKRKAVIIRDQYVSGNIPVSGASNTGSNTLAEFSPSKQHLVQS
jgi:hypothetical protein